MVDDETLVPVPEPAADHAPSRPFDSLVRPILETLVELTGLASAYLTEIDLDEDVQHVHFSENRTEGFEIPEGLVVPWADTLCKRALDEQRPLTTDVPSVWPDSAAARALGIETYVSVPVLREDGSVWGTLCAADPQRHPDAGHHLAALELFARLIAIDLRRSEAYRRIQDQLETVLRDADVDPLTRCSTRRPVAGWLRDRLDVADRGEVLIAAYIDLDDLKRVNDDLGHAAGDLLLASLAGRLQRVARPQDLVARLGGDEFLVAALLPGARVTQLEALLRGAVTFPVLIGEQPIDVRASLGIATAGTDDDPAALIARADAAMYEDKRARRTRSG